MPVVTTAETSTNPESRWSVPTTIGPSSTANTATATPSRELKSQNLSFLSTEEDEGKNNDNNNNKPQTNSAAAGNDINNKNSTEAEVAPETTSPPTKNLSNYRSSLPLSMRMLQFAPPHRCMSCPNCGTATGSTTAQNGGGFVTALTKAAAAGRRLRGGGGEEEAARSGAGTAQFDLAAFPAAWRNEFGTNTSLQHDDEDDDDGNVNIIPNGGVGSKNNAAAAAVFCQPTTPANALGNQQQGANTNGGGEDIDDIDDIDIVLADYDSFQNNPPPPRKSKRNNSNNNNATTILATLSSSSSLGFSPAVSSLVTAPMMNTLASPAHARATERILLEYMQACQFYGCGHRVNAGVLTTLRFQLPCLRVSGSFHDADMLALAEILLKFGNTSLKFIRRLDFSIASKEGKLHGRKGFRSHGALTLAKVLQTSEYITEVFLQRNRIGPFGASALFVACSGNPTIHKMNLRRCVVGERGAYCFAELIAPSSECGLTEIDLSANYIGFQGSMAIEQALLARYSKQRNDLHHIHVELEGNLVLQEVMNGVTHGLGVLLAFLGSYLLYKRVHGLQPRHSVSCMVYSASLIVLYVSSTLYHSFFTMQNVKYIFEVMDKCAIYVLIAGSYTPFLRIVLWHEPLWSTYLLGFIWACSLLGITVEAFAPTWKHKCYFGLAMYLGMGWSAIVCLPEVATIIDPGAMNYMVLGGVSYTAGVPFFVRDNNLDHAIWHLFVLGGSVFHFCSIYFYVATFGAETVATTAATATTTLMEDIANSCIMNSTMAAAAAVAEGSMDFLAGQ